MDEISEPEQPLEQNIEGFSRFRIYVLMALATIAASIAGLIFQNLRFGVGVLVGGLLAFGNFVWLDRSTKTIFSRAVEGISPGLPAFRYILRYVVLGGVLWLIWRTDAVPVVAVITGLSVFAAAVVADGIYRIFNTKG